MVPTQSTRTLAGSLQAPLAHSCLSFDVVQTGDSSGTLRDCGDEKEHVRFLVKGFVGAVY